MLPDRCLHVCLLGDPSVGASALLCGYLGEDGDRGGAANDIESAVTTAELEGELWRVRLTDNLGDARFKPIRPAALRSAHAVLLCFDASAGGIASLLSAQRRWAPEVWASGSEAPVFLVGFNADRRLRGDTSAVEEDLGAEVAARLGALAYLECPSPDGAAAGEWPESCRALLGGPLEAAKEFYSLQWQLSHELGPPDRNAMSGAMSAAMSAALSAAAVSAAAASAAAASAADAEGDPGEPAWSLHERSCPGVGALEQTAAGSAMASTDGAPAATGGAERGSGEGAVGGTPLEEATVRKSLSSLGRTPTREHAYLRCDVPELGLTSVEALRSFKHLQFLNVSKNRLCCLEPLGSLKSLLHLNASHNHLMRTQSFDPPNYLETVDMSYNLVAEVGDWSVHAYLRELNLRGNFICNIGDGLLKNRELRALDLSENSIETIECLDDLGLTSLRLSHNRLTSLSGLGALSALQALDVRHNMVTSIGALLPEELPRLRSLCVADNRLTHISEVSGLESFAFLCDLVLSPNPVAELPFYRSQVLHRLPRLRSLDAISAEAEEKVKSEVIYAFDVEARNDLFNELMPTEEFEDRRLMTEQGLVRLEMDKFGREGDAGPYGIALAEMPPPPTSDRRARLQEAKLRQLAAVARNGGSPAGVVDFTDFAGPFISVVVDDKDLPMILEAVVEGGIQRLILGAAQISADGIREIVSMLSRASETVHSVDLSGCKAVAGIVKELLNSFPYPKGCSLETSNCGLSAEQEDALRNQTEAAELVLESAAKERLRSAKLVEEFQATQEALVDLSEERRERGAPPAAPPPLCHPLKWRSGVSGEAEESLRACSVANPSGIGPESLTMRTKDGQTLELDVDELVALCELRRMMLVEWGCDVPEDEEEEEEDGEDFFAEVPGAVMAEVRRAPALSNAAVSTHSVAGGGGGGGGGGGPSRPLGGKALPEAFLAAFDQVLTSSSLLCFMLWEGVRPSDELKEDVRRKGQDWEADWNERQRRCRELTDKCRTKYGASGQLIAHFTYLANRGYLPDPCEPISFASFGLGRLGEGAPRPGPRRGVDLHEALNSGKISLEAANGRGFGRDSVMLRLVNLTRGALEVAVRQGTIFQHAGWQHQQNLLVSMDYTVVVPEGDSVLKLLHAFCMNHSCACPSGSPMALSDFYLDSPKALAHQSLVWDHFDACVGGKQ